MADYLRVDGAPAAEVSRYLGRVTQKLPSDAESAYVAGALAFRDGNLDVAKQKLAQANTLNQAATQHALLRASCAVGAAVAAGGRQGRRQAAAADGAGGQHATTIGRARCWRSSMRAGGAAADAAGRRGDAVRRRRRCAPSGAAASGAAQKPDKVDDKIDAAMAQRRLRQADRAGRSPERERPRQRGAQALRQGAVAAPERPRGDHGARLLRSRRREVLVGGRSLQARAGAVAELRRRDHRAGRGLQAARRSPRGAQLVQAVPVVAAERAQGDDGQEQHSRSRAEAAASDAPSAPAADEPKKDAAASGSDAGRAQESDEPKKAAGDDDKPVQLPRPPTSDEPPP